MNNMTSNHDISPKSLSLLIHALAEYPEIESAVLFGSRAKGTHRRGSDIDLAIKGKTCTSQIAVQLYGILNENLPIPYHVDIVHYESLQNTALIEHIDRVGILIYEKTIQ
jgi:predicted nucleotidyltransferase